MKTFNINQHIYIQIHNSGWNHLRKTVGNEYIKHCIEPHAKIINDEVWYRLQCHHVFDILPSNHGGLSFINTNIMFDDEVLNLKQV